MTFFPDIVENMSKIAVFACLWPLHPRISKFLKIKCHFRIPDTILHLTRVYLNLKGKKNRLNRAYPTMLSPPPPPGVPRLKLNAKRTEGARTQHHLSIELSLVSL